MDALTGLLDGPRAHGAFLLRSVMAPPWAIRIQDEAPLSLTALVRGEVAEAAELFENRTPVVSGITKRVCRHSFQEVCPRNVRFSQELREPAFTPRSALGGRDARTLARGC